MKRRAHKGFSVVEVMIVTLIFALIAGGLFSLLNMGNSVYATDTGLLDLHEQVRNAVDRMSREIRAASTTQVTVVNADSDIITFTTPTLTGARFYLNGTQLIREYPSGTTRVLANYIARLKFTSNGTLLTISVTGSHRVMLRTFTFSMTQKLRLRNE